MLKARHSLNACDGNLDIATFRADSTKGHPGTSFVLVRLTRYRDYRVRDCVPLWLFLCCCAFSSNPTQRNLRMSLTISPDAVIGISRASRPLRLVRGQRNIP